MESVPTTGAQEVKGPSGYCVLLTYMAFAEPASFFKLLGRSWSKHPLALPLK